MSRIGAFFGLVMFVAIAHAQSREFRITPYPPPNSSDLESSCGDANLHAKLYLTAPPSCSNWSGNLQVVSASPEGCFVHPVVAPSGEFVQNLGYGWSHWMLGTFALQGPRCTGVRGVSRAPGNW